MLGIRWGKVFIGLPASPDAPLERLRTEES